MDILLFCHVCRMEHLDIQVTDATQEAIYLLSAMARDRKVSDSNVLIFF